MSTPRPLSPAAQAVLEAHAKARCQREWSTVNDPPCHPSDPEWNGCGICVDRAGPAAAIRALTDLAYEDYNGMKFLYVPEILAIAAELDGGEVEA
jgi:hypothetical protein